MTDIDILIGYSGCVSPALRFALCALALFGLAPLRVWKEGELGGRPAGRFRLPNTCFGLPRSGRASPPLTTP
eukprot:scaffold7297_cov125-Isochrysis_galbana.AAC.7